MPDSVNRKFIPEQGGAFHQETEVISPEARQRAENAILESLGLNPSEGIANFQEKLKLAIKSLPQYARFEKDMAGKSLEELPYAVFKAIRKSNDEADERDGVPTDGALISSIRQGHIECAGRTCIASTYLQERGFPHVVVEAPSHSMLLFEIGNDTLGYCDANHNLYFTFPRAALAGYEGASTVSECRLQEYSPRPTDIADGFDMVYGHVITMPAEEGIAGQYLGTVKAALVKLPEFANTPIEKDREAADAIDEVQQEILGETNQKLADYFDQDRQMVNEREVRLASLENTLRQAMATSQSKENFIAWFDSAIQGSIGVSLPYLKNSPSEVRTKYAEDLYDRMV